MYTWKVKFNKIQSVEQGVPEHLAVDLLNKGFVLRRYGGRPMRRVYLLSHEDQRALTVFLLGPNGSSIIVDALGL